MSDNQPQEEPVERPNEGPTHKPFVEPTLQYETDLLDGTAGRTITWSNEPMS